MEYGYDPSGWERACNGKVALIERAQIVVSPVSKLRRVAQGSITGQITSLSVPQVKAGAYIDIVIAYNAYNPNGSFWNPWKIFIVAKDNLGHKDMAKDADVRDDEFSDSDSLRLFQMPSQSIQLEIRLYGHDELVSWNWDWW